MDLQRPKKVSVAMMRNRQFVRGMKNSPRQSGWFRLTAVEAVDGGELLRNQRYFSLPSKECHCNFLGINRFLVLQIFPGPKHNPWQYDSRMVSVGGRWDDEEQPYCKPRGSIVGRLHLRCTDGAAKFMVRDDKTANPSSLRSRQD